MFIIIVYLQNDVKRPTAFYYYTPVARGMKIVAMM